MKDMLSQGASEGKRQCILVEGDLVINVLTADGGHGDSPRCSIGLEGPVLLKAANWQELMERLAALGRPLDSSAPASAATEAGTLAEVGRALSAAEGKVMDRLMPIFRNEREQAEDFLRTIRGAIPRAVTNRVNELLATGQVNPDLCHKPLWSILHEHGFYFPHREQLEPAHRGSPQAVAFCKADRPYKLMLTMQHLNGRGTLFSSNAWPFLHNSLSLPR